MYFTAYYGFMLPLLCVACFAQVELQEPPQRLTLAQMMSHDQALDTDSVLDQRTQILGDQMLIDHQLSNQQRLDLSVVDQMQDMRESSRVVDFQIPDLSILDKQAMIEWIRFEPGRFDMGSQRNMDEQPIREVQMTQAFELSKTEITVAQYRECVIAGQCEAPRTGIGCNWDIVNRENHPVNCVTWYQSKAFAIWLGGDLPSEKQWEYAATSYGRVSPFTWQNGMDINCELVNYASCESSTRNVCESQGMTKEGLCDILGNVAEWVLDIYLTNYSSTNTNNELPFCHDLPSCEMDLLPRVYRGGGWRNMVDRISNTARWNTDPNYQSFGNIGFRVVKKP